MFVAISELLVRHGTSETLAEMIRLPVAAWESLNHGLFEWGSGSEKAKYEPFFTTNNLQGLIHSLHLIYAHKYPSALVRTYLAFCEERIEKLN